MFTSIAIGIITKIISGFGLPALNGWIKHLESKDIQYTKRWIVAATTQTEIVKAEMQYRIALLNTKVGTILVILIVGMPALHWALVWLDTILISFGLPLIGIEAAPPEYASLGSDIMLAFIGVKGAAGISSVIMKGLKK